MDQVGFRRLSRPLSARPPVALALAVACVWCLHHAAVAQSMLRSPEQAFGFRPGSDQKLIGWQDSLDYFRQLARGSERLRVIDIGKTTMGKPLIAAVISSRENLARVDYYRDLVRQLGDARKTPPDAAGRLAAEGKVIVAIGCSIHASELGAAQMAPDLAYRLAAGDSPQVGRILDNVILLLFPSMNPDGMDLVVDYYKQTLGKPWEGGQMPWLYNKYVGHDINRDFFMLNMLENREFAKVFYEDWRPQVFLTMHQMGERGPRLFVPPNWEPVDPNYEPLIWREAGLLGHAIATDLAAHGMKGVITNAMYDYFFPGYEDSGPIGHNTVCMLTEAASARLATPVTVKREELQGTPKGLPEYGVTQNFPDPWEGGTWRLGDIVEYDLEAAVALLDGAAKYREELLRNFYQMGKNQVEKGKTLAPYAFVVPATQRDPLTAVKMINTLRAGGVEVWRAKAAFQADGRQYGAGSFVVLMEQPFRAYAKTLLERQVYPARRLTPGGPQERPYDVTGWTLPLQMGVDTVSVPSRFGFETEPVDRAVPAPVGADGRGTALVLPGEMNDSVMAVNRILKDGGTVMRVTAPVSGRGGNLVAGSFVVSLSTRGGKLASARAVEQAQALSIPTTTLAAWPSSAAMVQLKAPRVGLYKPWTANMDEGWTRWLLEQYEFTFTSLPDAEIRAGNLATRFDVIVLPSARGQSLVTGNRSGSVPPGYAGGLGPGVAKLREFVEGGGTVVALGESSRFAIEQFGLPVRDVVSGLKPEMFSCPGSILRTAVDPTHPVGFGMPEESIAVFQMSPAFEVLPAFGGVQPRTVVKYPEGKLLLSGWIEGESILTNRAGVVDVPLGKGRVILLGFGVQQRAQPHATFKLLFNALYYSVTGGVQPDVPRHR
jgi:hypothetical protein